MGPQLNDEWRVSVRVPRRNRLSIFIQRFFHYIVAGLIVVGTVSTVAFRNWVFILYALVALLLAGIFWEALNLELEKEKPDHPHHRGWGRVASGFRYISRATQHTPFTFVATGFWGLATILIIQGGILMKGNVVLTWFLIQGWVLYLPSLWVASWNIKHHPSEWFIGLYLAAVMTYSFEVFVVFPKESLLDKLAIIVSQCSWLLLTGGFVHFLLRKLLLYNGQVIVAHAVIQELRENSEYLAALDPAELDGNPDIALNNLAQFIASNLGYDRVFIVLADQFKGRLFLKGSNITGVDALQKEGWPRDGWLIGTESITGWVAKNKLEHMCPNTKECELYYQPPGFEPGFKVASEIAVPILVDDLCVGVIDIESPSRSAFDKADAHLLWQIANSVGGALTHKRQLRKTVSATYELFEEAAKRLSSSQDLTATLGAVVEMTKLVLRADLVTLYRHAIGTQMPLSRLIWRGISRDKEYLDMSINPDNHLVLSLIRSGAKEFYKTDASNDPDLLGPNNGEYTLEEQARHRRKYRFIKREEIKSSAYISLGFEENIVGSLFINYRDRTNFTEDYKQRLRALRSFMSLALLLRQEVDRYSGSLAGAASISHSKAELAFAALRTAIKEAVAKEGQDCQVPLLRIREKVDDLERGWADLVLAEPADFSMTLSANLDRLRDKVSRYLSSLKSDWTIDHRIDRVPVKVQEVVYKLIAEAVSNAVLHGDASRIWVEASLDPDSLWATVRNDGKSMAAEDLVYLNSLDYLSTTVREQSGIKALLMDSQNWFGGTWNYASQDDEIVFSFSIPLLRN